MSINFLRGIIHQCDNMLKNQIEHKDHINSLFYLIYANALFDLSCFKGELINDNENEAYMIEFSLELIEKELIIAKSFFKVKIT